MSNSLIFYLIIGVVIMLSFIRSHGIKNGIIISSILFFIGALLGLISIYFSDNMKIILSIVLITLAIAFSYPPNKKKLLNKIKQILKK